MNAKTLIVAGTLLTLAGVAAANPVDGIYSDTPGCDDHGVQFAFEELGNPGVFPADELISSASNAVPISACVPTDDPFIPNELVTMTNLSGTAWQNLYYVADQLTTFTNIDGEAVSFADPSFARTPAFRIDAVGVNTPLIFESMTVDGIFEVGETWEFVVQDYLNAFGLPASAFLSLDFAGASSSDTVSSASIIAFDPVPTPGSVSLLALAGLGAARRRRG